METGTLKVWHIWLDNEFGSSIMRDYAPKPIRFCTEAQN